MQVCHILSNNVVLKYDIEASLFTVITYTVREQICTETSVASAYFPCHYHSTSPPYWHCHSRTAAANRTILEIENVFK